MKWRRINDKRIIQEKLERIDQVLRTAEEYVARDENVYIRSFCHFKDWQGKSGHPLWMKNFMIPARKRGRARKERALERVIAKEKGMKHQKRRELRAAQR
jgi:hypothetical protein